MGLGQAGGHPELNEVTALEGEEDQNNINNNYDSIDELARSSASQQNGVQAFLSSPPFASNSTSNSASVSHDLSRIWHRDRRRLLGKLLLTRVRDLPATVR